MADELRRLRRELRIHRASLCLGLVVLAHCGAAVDRPPAEPSAPVDSTSIEVLTVQRIDVRDADGTLRMVISNDEHAPGPVVDPKRGEESGRVGGNGAGIVFYNEKGGENGKLFIDGKSVGLSIDRWQQDQTLVLGYGEEGSGYSSGMMVYERPDHPHAETMARVAEIAKLADGQERRSAMRAMQDAGAFGTYRMFVGKDEAGAASIELADRQQRPRLRMSVDASGEPRLEFLDANGAVTLTLPPADAGGRPEPR
jgi:hypothetical protein